MPDSTGADDTFIVRSVSYKSVKKHAIKPLIMVQGEKRSYLLPVRLLRLIQSRGHATDWLLSATRSASSLEANQTDGAIYNVRASDLDTNGFFYTSKFSRHWRQ